MLYGPIGAGCQGMAAQAAAGGIEVRNLLAEGTTCRGCGECCGRLLPLIPGEAEKIAAWAKSHGIRPHRPRGGLLVEDMMCPWLADDGTCSVYEARPLVCRAFRCDKGRTGFTWRDIFEIGRAAKAAGAEEPELVDMRAALLGLRK